MRKPPQQRGRNYLAGVCAVVGLGLGIAIVGCSSKTPPREQVQLDVEEAVAASTDNAKDKDTLSLPKGRYLEHPADFVPPVLDAFEPREQAIFGAVQIVDRKWLLNDEIGRDPSVGNYNVDRIEDVSVPHPVNRSEPIGVTAATDIGLLEHRRLGGGMLPGGFGGRSGAARERLVAQGGGNVFSEAAVAAGLHWLVQHQAADGRWAMDEFHKHGNCNCTGQGEANDIAGTAYALLPFLGAGQSHKGVPGRNRYERPVEKGLKFLLLKQDRDGRFSTDPYAQGIATLAICEAYGMTSDPALRGPAQRALSLIVESQKEGGGWSPGAEADPELLLGVWQISALKSGQMAGLNVPAAAYQRYTRFLDRVASEDKGRYGNTRPPRPEGGSAETTSAAGLLCRQYLGWGPRNPGLSAGVRELQKAPPSVSIKDPYYHYFASQVMHHMGGEGWTDWNGKMRETWISLQDKGAEARFAHQRGSYFFPFEARAPRVSRLVTTSLALQNLEIYYRHLPLYRRDVGGEPAPVNPAPEPPKPPKHDLKKPQVWKKDGKTPTFARVFLGGGNSLELVRQQVTVSIDGPRARTLVDHVFHNPHDKQLEGTFEYPLPTGASPCYFAMFIGQTRDEAPAMFGRGGAVPNLPDEALASANPADVVRLVDTNDWGKLQEARVVSKQKALETYEDIVRQRVDPALLEHAGGNTFRGRVFPIPRRGYNRVLIAYEELLPISEGRVQYQFPLPDCEMKELQVSIRSETAECRDVKLSDGFRTDEGGGRALHHRSWKDQGPGGTVAFSYKPADERVQAISGRPDEKAGFFVYARIRPELKSEAAKPFAQQAVFLLDTSLSEHPDRFNTNIKLMKRILETDRSIERFNVLTFNVGTAWLEPKGWLENTDKGREQMLAKLDGTVLEGATDLGAALDALVKPGFEVSKETPVNIFLLSDGHVTWGEADSRTLVARFDEHCPFPTQFNCYRLGIGAENIALFEALTRRGGGVFQCLNEKELDAAAAAHRNHCLRVERVRFVGGPAASDVLVSGRKAAVFPGGELVVAGRVPQTGKTTIVVEGSFQGAKFAQEYPIEITGRNELAPRGWAEIAVASLLALGDPKLDGLITAYCQQFGVGSRVASFLVLEDEKDYTRLNLEDERGKTVTGDFATFLDVAWKKLGKVLPPREAFNGFLERIEPRIKLMAGPEAAHVKRLLALLGDRDFELPEATLRGAILKKSDVPAAYLEARAKDRRAVTTYFDEAKRRATAGDIDGAIRVLSCVVEEHPGRGEALRQVGYRLLDLQQPVHAVRLFQQVQSNRPFEPHSYRDLARSLEACDRFGLAAVQYEILLAGTWHNRFGAALKEVAREEYAHMMQEAIRSKKLPRVLAEHFGDRLERMTSPQPKSDLRVTISWDTDNTDVDLWIQEPDGFKCFYEKNRSPSGGELSQDQTQGYGPERYRAPKALPGEYTILVHYFRANPNLLAGETHVNVVVTRNAGTPEEKTERHTVLLKKEKEAVEVCKIKY